VTLGEAWGPAIPPMTDEEFALLAEFTRERFGLELSFAHRDRVRFRLRGRLEALSIPSFLEYYRFLRLSPAAHLEVSFLAEALTNGETFLFREAYQFRCFFETVAPSALAGRPAGEPLRVLSAGCSSGEEAYSLSIAWHESRHRVPGRSCEIHGVDLNAARVRKAELGEYEGLSLRAMTPELKSRYFSPAGEGLRVKRPLREGVRFSVLNLLEVGDAFEPEFFDAVFCRNVFIYFDERLMYRICGLFHKLLRPGGALFLGHSESLLGRTSLFRPQRAAEFIFYLKVGG
jgi:chemotaxis protein methyltransferase CheR